MVDREARGKLAERVRHLATDRITQNEFYEMSMAFLSAQKDPVLDAIYFEAEEIELWERQDFARWINFLYTNQEYKWASDKWGGLVFLITAFMIALYICSPICAAS